VALVGMEATQAEGCDISSQPGRADRVARRDVVAEPRLHRRERRSEVGS
jgi:hypothetical protein